jgi:hypothetical protein
MSLAAAFFLVYRAREFRFARPNGEVSFFLALMV